MSTSVRIRSFRRHLATLLALVGSLLLAPIALAQSSPTQWTDDAYTGGTGIPCSSCHGNPASLSGDIDFTDDALFASYGSWIARVNGGVNSYMTYFATNASVSNGDRMAVYNYLVNVREARVTASVAAFPQTDVSPAVAPTRVVTIENFRSSSIGFTASTNSSDFTVTSNCGSTVAAQSTCTLTIRFSPLQGASVNRSGSLTITFNSAAVHTPFTRVIGLSGTVTPGAFSFSTNTLAFSSRAGTPLDVRIGNVVNTGSATMRVSSISVPVQPAGATYTVITPPGACSTGITDLVKNDSCEVWIRYSPALGSPGITTNASVQIAHNAGNTASPRVVVVSGTATRSLFRAPLAQNLPFGSVQLGVAKPLTFDVHNDGDVALNFQPPIPSSAGARTGPAAADYSVSGCAGAVAPGGFCTLTITLTPSALNARDATLTINGDAVNGPLVLTLSGTGVALPEPTISGPGTDFPATVINQSSSETRTLTIGNTRTRAVVYSVANLTDFRVVSESCGPGRTVPGGGTCTVVTEFRPTLGAGETHRTGSFAFTFTGTLGDANPDPINVAVAGDALLPLGQSASSLAAAAVVGSPTMTTVMLTNRSSSPITLSTLVFTGPAGSDYSLAAGNTCTPGLVLAVGAPPCSLVVRFNPPSPGTRNATLTITHTAPGSPQTVTYLGTATPAPQGRIELSATTLAFADTQLASSSPRTVTVHNGGNLALNFSAFTFGGTHPGDFNRAGTCAVGTPLPIGADCTVVVNFAPAALGLRTGTLTITSDASNGAAVITLSGTGVPIPVPVVSLTPAVLDFGTQTIGGLYPARRVRLANTGTADLTVASVVVAGAGFGYAGPSPCPATLAPGAGCDIDIAFNATAATPFTGTLTVSDNAVGSPHVTQLIGTGSASALPVLAYLPATPSLDFGNVSAGAVSGTQTVTVQNQGPGGVSLTLLNTVGPDASSFSVVGGSCAVGVPMFEGASCTVVLQFSPGAGGAKTAMLQIASTGSFPPVLTLTGTGLAGPSPSLALSTGAMAFEATRVGAQSVPATVRITSSGSGVVTVSAIAVTGAFAIQSSTCPAPPFSLPAGTECTVSLNFRPTDTGTAAGTLSVTSDAAPTVREVALSGTGEGSADTSSGGCTIGDGRSPVDPTLWAMLLLAAAWLGRRGLQRRALRRARSRRDTSVQARRELP